MNISGKAMARFRVAPLLLAMATLTACMGHDNGVTQSSAPSATTDQTVAITLNGTPATEVKLGDSFYFQPEVAPGSADREVTYKIEGMPAWATFDSGSGSLSGTPDSTAIGESADITIVAASGKRQGSVGPFKIIVRKPSAPDDSPLGANHRPTISGTPRTRVIAGRTYSFKPAAADADGDALHFWIRNKPAWARFNTSTGRLSGTPATTDAGIYREIAIYVSDGKVSASLPAFSIRVRSPADTDTPPTISGSPTTSVPAGSTYSFTPSASDANDDPLAFRIQNKPPWAAFSMATGELSGTPSAASAGIYTKIIISVSDGLKSAALAPFSIAVTVAPPATGSATLSWSVPTQNTDGSALKNLAGYRIYYGTNPVSLTQVVTITDVGTTSYQITGLSRGTWYFGIKAYTSAGAESSLSNIGSKTI